MNLINGISIGLILILIGFFGISTRKNIIKIILSLNICFMGIILFYISIAYVEGGTIPVLGPFEPIDIVDPLPHALMLTTAVVELSTTALALALVMKVYEKYETLNVREMKL
ncbi:MAG: cation:proton antiporter subunit C [Theionarchaea archaeon]|nr:cation:proton antiporter subunit C [Theionarchaea archaeon]